MLLSIASLICLIVNGLRDKSARGIGIWAAVALFMMMAGSIGTGLVPPQYFGIAERFSVFAAVGFNAVLGVYLFMGFRGNAAHRRGRRPVSTARRWNTALWQKSA